MTLIEDADGAPLPPELQRGGAIWRAIADAMILPPRLDADRRAVDRAVIALAPILAEHYAPPDPSRAVAPSVAVGIDPADPRSPLTYVRINPEAFAQMQAVMSEYFSRMQHSMHELGRTLSARAEAREASRCVHCKQPIFQSSFDGMWLHRLSDGSGRNKCGDARGSSDMSATPVGVDPKPTPPNELSHSHSPAVQLTGMCCDSHQIGPTRANGMGWCCDVNDCGPCCEHCPTCPTIAKAAVKAAIRSFLGEASDDEPRPQIIIQQRLVDEYGAAAIDAACADLNVQWSASPRGPEGP